MTPDGAPRDDRATPAGDDAAPSGDRVPRQVAVALRWQETVDPAPRVIAKGRGPVADTIRRLAREHGVPERTDADLARALSALDLDQVIPDDLYQAVAEVLAWVWRMDQQAAD